ncbi:MAG TPA: sterol desaturase family protein [Rubellimicrobium sp.]|jgi:sterol desaturase/sphingolipid hydroxylase (fatty acid hydroxylase superfamily)|nr:sterol desaturase family protein [Rubellimicrobium sp.]
MDDSAFGTRNKRGDWTPNEPLRPAPVFVWPLRPLAALRWLPSYFLPWNVLFMGFAAVTWFWLTPSADTLRTLAPGWVLWILLRNTVGVALFYGLFQWHFYTRRRQGTAFKYEGKWPDGPNETFLFKSQLKENLLLTFVFGVPIWSAYEVLALWAWANGVGAWTTFGANPLWLVGFGLLVPFIHELHFYLVHRLIHWGPLYRHIHSVHHNSVNPAPFSSLSMHPVEHLLYFSGVLLHLMLPSHPLLALYALNFAGYGAVVGHIGFDRIVAGEGVAMDTHAYNHHLHHRYFEVNYSEGLVPFDRLFGTFHDGSKAGDAAMQARFKAKRERAARAR